MVRTPTSPSCCRFTEAGVALGPLDAPGQPAFTGFSPSAGLQAQAYDTDFAPPFAVSVAVQVLPLSVELASTHAPSLTIQPGGVDVGSGVPSAPNASVASMAVAEASAVAGVVQ